MLKILFVFLGSLSLMLAIIGISIPGLPTTPFLLLSATLYVKSSNKLYNWLINHPILGKIIKEYREKKGLTFKKKWLSIIIMWIMISASVTWGISNLHLRVLVIIVGLIGTVFMGRIPTYKDE